MTPADRHRLTAGLRDLVAKIAGDLRQKMRAPGSEARRSAEQLHRDERIRAILALDEDLEDAQVPLSDRVALLDSAWRLLPEAAREDEAIAGRLQAELQALVGPEGPSPEVLDDWRKRFPPPKKPKSGIAKRGKKAKRGKRAKADA